MGVYIWLDEVIERGSFSIAYIKDTVRINASEFNPLYCETVV